MGSGQEENSPYLVNRKRKKYVLSKTTANNNRTIAEAVVDYSPTDSSDYFFYGWWLTVKEDTGGPVADAGSFSSGLYNQFTKTGAPQPALPASGTVVYEEPQGASGLHMVVYDRPK